MKQVSGSRAVLSWDLGDLKSWAEWQVVQARPRRSWAEPVQVTVSVSLRAYQAKKIGGFLHLYIGQEAVAVGCCSLMGKNDHVITAYRDHATAATILSAANRWAIPTLPAP